MITWNIKDRKSGQSIIIPNPTTPGESDTLRMILKNCAEMGNQRHGEGRHKHVGSQRVTQDDVAQPLAKVA